MTCTESDYSVLAPIINILGFASHVKLDVPAFGSTSHMKFERVPETATFGTSNEIYYFIILNILEKSNLFFVYILKAVYFP
jgi:hypothetical protein